MINQSYFKRLSSKTVAILFLCLLSCCVPYKSLVNFNESAIPKEPQQITEMEPLKIQAHDILTILVASQEEIATAVFNQSNSSSYLVDAEGTIDFPLIGQVTLAGKTINESKALLLSKLNKYFVTNPTINIALSNFKVVVNGEVGSPGVLQVPNQRINIIDAITLSGDFTPYSMRDSIMIIREVGDQRTFGFVDFNSIDLFNSPYFYLKQNDIVYVKPEKRFKGTVRDQESKYIPYISAGVSLILLISTIIRFTN